MQMTHVPYKATSPALQGLLKRLKRLPILGSKHQQPKDTAMYEVKMASQMFWVRLESNAFRKLERQTLAAEYTVSARTPTEAVLEAMEASSRLDPNGFPSIVKYQVKTAGADGKPHGFDIAGQVSAHAVRQLALLRCTRFGKEKSFHVFGVCRSTKQRREFNVKARTVTQALLNAVEEIQRDNSATSYESFAFCGVVEAFEETSSNDVDSNVARTSHSYRKTRRDTRSLHTVLTLIGTHCVYAHDSLEAERKFTAHEIAGVLPYSAHNEFERANLELIRWELHRKVRCVGT